MNHLKPCACRISHGGSCAKGRGLKRERGERGVGTGRKIASPLLPLSLPPSLPVSQAATKRNGGWFCSSNCKQERETVAKVTANDSEKWIFFLSAELFEICPCNFKTVAWQVAQHNNAMRRKCCVSKALKSGLNSSATLHGDSNRVHLYCILVVTWMCYWISAGLVWEKAWSRSVTGSKDRLSDSVA